MADIPRTEIPVDRLAVVRHALLRQAARQVPKQLVERRARMHRNVKDLARTLWHVERSENIGLHRIVDKTKIPTRFAIAVDVDIVAADH